MNSQEKYQGKEIHAILYDEASNEVAELYSMDDRVQKIRTIAELLQIDDIDVSEWDDDEIESTYFELMDGETLNFLQRS